MTWSCWTGAEPPGHVALAIAADGGEQVTVVDGDAASHRAPSYAVRCHLEVPAKGRVETAFYIGAGPERDGACATVGVLRRRGWRSLLTATRDAIRSLEQTTGMESLDGLINRHLLFAYFYAVARALDDAHYYLVRSRAPWCARGVTIRDWEALAWTVPAVQLADPPLARELILRACEIHGYAPGRGVHYFDGTLFEPGFTLEGAAAYAIATDRYIRDTARRPDRRGARPGRHAVPLVGRSRRPARQDAPALSHRGHALGHARGVSVHAARQRGGRVRLECLKRTLDEEEAKELPDPEAMRAAIRRHFTSDGSAKNVFLASTDLAGGVSREDDPVASALWLPLYETVDRLDSVYRRTAKKAAGEPHNLVQQLARLFGPDASSVLEWLRRAPLDHGLAAEFVDAEGRAIGSGGDAALSGLVAYVAWYTVHAHGLRP